MNRNLLEAIFEENRQALVVTNTEIREREQRMQRLKVMRELMEKEFERHGWPVPIAGVTVV